MMREAIILDGSEPVDVIVLPEGADGDALLSATCVEITDLDPKPGLGLGWKFVKGKFVPPPVPSLTWKEVEEARRARYQAETDGMFFAAQRDGTSLDDWKAAVDQIKADLPYPQAPA